MSRRPAVLHPAQLRDAARAAVASAIQERTIAISEAEARATSGGYFIGPEPTLSGAVIRIPGTLS